MMIEAKHITEAMRRWEDSGRIQGSAEIDREDAEASEETHAVEMEEAMGNVLTGLDLADAAQRIMHEELRKAWSSDELAGTALGGLIIGLTARQLADEDAGRD